MGICRWVGAGLKDDRFETIIVGKTRPYLDNKFDKLTISKTRPGPIAVGADLKNPARPHCCRGGFYQPSSPQTKNLKNPARPNCCRGGFYQPSSPQNNNLKNPPRPNCFINRPLQVDGDFPLGGGGFKRRSILDNYC
ncbi:MAG: hypothetical protein EAZ68_08005, partial [Oscillatoriales cyanobacterium]